MAGCSHGPFRPPLHGRALREPVENVRGLVRRPPCKRIAHPQRWLVRPQTGLPPQPRRDSRSDHDRSAPRLTAARCGSGAALPPDTPPHRPQWPRRPPCCLTRGPSLGGRGPQAVRPGGASPRKKAHTAPLCHKAGPRAPSPSHRHCLALWRSPLIRETTSIRLVEGG